MRRESLKDSQRSRPFSDATEDDKVISRVLTRVERELSLEFQHTRLLVVPESGTALLRQELNRCAEKRREKAAILERLKGVFLTGKDSETENRHVRGLSEGGRSVTQTAQDLEQEIKQREGEVDLEEGYSDILLTMQSRVKSGLSILKQRTRYLEFALRKVSQQHTSVLDTLHTAETAHTLQSLQLSRTRRSLSESLSALQVKLQAKKQQKDQLSSSTRLSLTRISQVRMREDRIREENQSKINGLLQDYTRLVSVKEENRLRKRMVSSWASKLRSIQRLLPCDDWQCGDKLDPAAVNSIVAGYFRLISAELSLKARYEAMCEESEELTGECQSLRKELYGLKSAYERSRQRPESTREDLHWRIGEEEEKARKGATVEGMEGDLVDVYWKISNLARRTLRRLEFIREKGGLMSSDLALTITSFTTLLRGNMAPPKETNRRERRKSESERRFSDPTELTFGQSNGFVPGLPVVTLKLNSALKSLPNPNDIDIDKATDLYKSAQILNYFTDVGQFAGFVPQLISTDPDRVLFQALFLLVESAYDNFRSHMRLLVDGHVKLYGGIYESLMQRKG